MIVSRNILCRLLTAAFILTVATLQGQGFIKIYPPVSASASALVQTADGGYFMAGEIAFTDQIFLQKTNGAGVPVWVNHLSLQGARALAASKASDGGFVVLAENYADTNGLKNLLFKLDPAGNLLWQQVLDNTFLPNGLRDFIATADGNFLAAGNTRDALLNQDVWLLKFDQSGATLWSQKIGDPAVNEAVSSLVELPGGSIAVCGTGLHNGDQNLFLLKTDATGNPVWEKWYDKPGFQISYDLLVLSDGGLMLLADTYAANPTKIALLKTDADGTEDFYVETFPWPTSGNNPLYIINSFVRDAADNVYITGSGGYFGDPTNTIGFLLKMDAGGATVWLKELGTAGTPWKIINTSDNKFAICGDLQSAGAFLLKANEDGDVYTNKIAGSLYHDSNSNCLPDGGEPALALFVVKAENQIGETFFKNVAPDGTFLMPVSEGDFTLTASATFGAMDFWENCNNQVIPVSGSYQTVQADPLGLRSVADCPQMYVEIGAPFLRRCVNNTFNVMYCNSGNETATQTSVTLTLSDPLLQYSSSTIPLTGQSGNALYFDLPDVAPGQCGTFNVTLLIDCAAQLGDLLCVEAHIYPDTICPTSNSAWDGSQLEVTGACDGEVTFNIKNIGAGDMTSQVDYVIVEDQIMYMQGAIQLDAGEDTVITVLNPSGGPYFLQTSQSPGYPVSSTPSAIVSPCGGPAVSSALQFPNDEAEPYIAVFCDEVVGSYDPNDKRGFPLGWKDAHYIERGQELEYTVRFQNTGTDTAFLVVIRDSLSALLNPASVRPGTSSHPYTWTIEGAGVLTFRFDDILLVDSFKNEPASHGYVTFSIAQQPDLPLGTVLENKADIYFDFNAAVATNTCFHTLGKPFSTLVSGPAGGTAGLQILPNPFTDQALFRLDGVAANTAVQLSLCDARGQLVRTESFTGAEYLFRKNTLPPGVYFLRLESNGRLLVSGKVVVGN